MNFDDATQGFDDQYPLFGSDANYHEINYRKSPFVIHDKFFNKPIVNKILNFFEFNSYQQFNDTKSRFEYISANECYDEKKYNWLKVPLSKLAYISNKTNFMLDIYDLEYINLYKFHEGDSLYWHHDCDWWFNPLPYDKKLTVMVQLTDHSEYEGGEIESFMSTVPLPKQHYNYGSVTIIPSYYYYMINQIIKGTKKMLICNVIGPKYK